MLTSKQQIGLISSFVAVVMHRQLHLVFKRINERHQSYERNN